MFVSGRPAYPNLCKKLFCVYIPMIDLNFLPVAQLFCGPFKVLRPSCPNYCKNVEWIPYVFCKEYCSECQTN